jgi:hypothetical protein
VKVDWLGLLFVIGGYVFLTSTSLLSFPIL